MKQIEEHGKDFIRAKGNTAERRKKSLAVSGRGADTVRFQVEQVKYISLTNNHICERKKMAFQESIKLKTIIWCVAKGAEVLFLKPFYKVCKDPH